MANTFSKDPYAILDYLFDWKANTNQSSENPEVTDWLEDGETISSFVITPTFVSGSSGSLISIIDSYSTSGSTSVTVWLGGGELNRDYSIGCKITTSSSPVARVDERSIKIQVRNL